LTERSRLSVQLFVTEAIHRSGRAQAATDDTDAAAY
jgi:hypothetical protein